MTEAIVIGGPGFIGGHPVEARAGRGHGGMNRRTSRVRGCTDTKTAASQAVDEAIACDAATNGFTWFSDWVQGRASAVAAAW